MNTRNEIKTFILELYNEKFTAKGLSPSNIPDSYDLFLEGIIDSLGLLELVSAVEDRFEVKLDMDQMDPEKLTMLGAFCDFVHGSTVRIPSSQ